VTGFETSLSKGSGKMIMGLIVLMSVT